nr:nadh dehydrogenase [ubiquinone] 1 alpha subcomplex assembly factor 3 [Quercus suber]
MYLTGLAHRHVEFQIIKSRWLSSVEDDLLGNIGVMVNVTLLRESRAGMCQGAFCSQLWSHGEVGMEVSRGTSRRIGTGGFPAVPCYCQESRCSALLQLSPAYDAVQLGVFPGSVLYFSPGNQRPRAVGARQCAQTCRTCLHTALSRRGPIRSSPIATASSPSRIFQRQSRCLHASPLLRGAPKSRDRGPASKEDTQTDFQAMDMLSNTPAPTTAVDACMDDGFALNSGMKVTGAGVLLIGGEAFKWRPWTGAGGKGSPASDGIIGNGGKSTRNDSQKLCNDKGQLEVDQQVWGVLDLVWPKPDLLVLGTGSSVLPVSPETRRHLSELGIRLEVQDTRNAAAQFNLLATERGVQQVVAALIPIGWKDARQ